MALRDQAEHVRFSDSSAYRGEVLATDYLGHHGRFVTFATPKQGNLTTSRDRVRSQTIAVGEKGRDWNSISAPSRFFNVGRGAGLCRQAQSGGSWDMADVILKNVKTKSASARNAALIIAV